MKGKEHQYQKCVEKIVIDKWNTDYTGGLPKSVAIYFVWNKKTTSFRWKPKWIELKDIILKLTELCGKEEVEKKLKIKI